MRNIFRLRFVLCCAMLAVAGACEKSTTDPVGPPAALQVVGANAATVAAGAAAADSLAVKVVDDNGRGVSGIQVTWQGDPATGGATVSPASSVTNANGIARTAVTGGTRAGPSTASARITANGQPVTLAYVVTVNAGPAASLAIAPVSGVMANGTTRTLTVAATDQYGNATSAAGAQWTSSAPTVAEVSAAGLVSGRGVGSAQFTASLNGVVSQPVTVSVVPTQMMVCETQNSMVCGTWNWNTDKYSATWADGATADVTVVRFLPESVEFRRVDFGKNPDFTATYIGTISGRTAGGTVTWSIQGTSATGTWTTQW